MTAAGLLPEDAYTFQAKEGDIDFPFWEGLRRNELRIQRCSSCAGFQWGPDVICHHCLSFEVAFEAVSPRGTICSWQRSWHPAHPSLAAHVPYVVLVVALDDAPSVMLLGNVTGDQREPITIGAPVVGQFEHHDSYSLLQWRRE